MHYISCEPSWKLMSASGSHRHSNDQWSFLVNRLLGPNMFNPPPPVGAKKIEAEAVYFLINFVDEPILQDSPLSRVHNAFENGKLNSLPIVFTRLRHSIQTPGALGVCC
jgi:hypothetical protein